MKLAPLLLAPLLAIAAHAAQPNIVLIFCDDLATHAISAYRHPLKLLATPNIDRIAQEGMRFDRGLVPNSICGPSRAVILTGKYSHVNGFVRNGTRKTLHAELVRLRTELKVPEQDPAGSGGGRKGKAK